MPGARGCTKPMSFWLGGDVEVSCPPRAKAENRSNIGVPVGGSAEKTKVNRSFLGGSVDEEIMRETLALSWGGFVDRVWNPLRSPLRTMSFRSFFRREMKLQNEHLFEHTSSEMLHESRQSERKASLDTLAGVIKLKTALEPLGGLPAALLIRQVFFSHQPKRRAFLIAACLLLLQGEIGSLEQIALPLDVLAPFMRVPAEAGRYQVIAPMLRVVQFSGCASLVFASLASSHSTVTLIALVCLTVTRCYEQRALGVLLGTEISCRSAGVHWPILGACVGGGLLHLGASPGLLLPLTAIPSISVALWACCIEWEVHAESHTYREVGLQSTRPLQQAMLHLPALHTPLRLVDAAPVLWQICLPFGLWGPWLSNAEFQLSMIAFAAPLLLFEAAVTVWNHRDDETPASTSGQGAQPILSFQVLRVIGVAHVVWFHQLHEGSIIERLSCPVALGSLSCHIGMAGMYWVGFFFMLSGFVNAYQRMGRTEGYSERCYSSSSFAWKRIADVYPQYICAVVLGTIGAMAAANGVREFALQPGNVLGVVKAFTFSNVMVYPYNYGDLSGLSHLWYICSLVFFWFRFEDWASLMQRLPRHASWFVLFYCWSSTFAIPAADHLGMLVPGSIVQQTFGIPRYFAFYHPMNNWMFFAGGVALARLMQTRDLSSQRLSLISPDSISDEVARSTSSIRVWWDVDWLVSRLGASAALTAIFIVIPLVDWANPTNILFRVVHGYLSFPGFAMVIFAVAQERDVLLSLPSRLGMSRGIEVLGAISGSCFLLHKPLHEVQWTSVPLLHSKAVIWAITHGSDLAEHAARALEWVYENGLYVHWALVLGGGSAVHKLLPTGKTVRTARPDVQQIQESSASESLSEEP